MKRLYTIYNQEMKLLIRMASDINDNKLFLLKDVCKALNNCDYDQALTFFDKEDITIIKVYLPGNSMELEGVNKQTLFDFLNFLNTENAQKIKECIDEALYYGDWGLNTDFEFDTPILDNRSSIKWYIGDAKQEFSELYNYIRLLSDGLTLKEKNLVFNRAFYELVESEPEYSIYDVAKLLKLNIQGLLEILQTAELIEVHNDNIIFAKLFEERGYIKDGNLLYLDLDGEIVERNQKLFTPKGFSYLRGMCLYLVELF